VKNIKTLFAMNKSIKNNFSSKTMVLALMILSIATLTFCTTFSSGEKASRKKSEETLVFSTQVNPAGMPLEIFFEKGKAFNHPLMAIWVEDLDGNYLQTLYVAQSIAKGYYRHGDSSSGRWMPGPMRRPAALPYWGHKRGVQAEDGLYMPSQAQPMEDAITGATPKTNFMLKTQTPKADARRFNVLFEINQSWDWNHYWHNNKFPDDEEYKTSAQPALVYKATIDLDSGNEIFEMKAIGHSHWSGANGELSEDISTITTALNIAKSISLRIL
jgi:hypothetical protein